MAETNSMAQRPLGDSGDTATPEDVATLYSWANLHGAKYRDFSASRAQAREEARLRVEAALAERRRREEEEAERRAQEEAQLAARLAAEAAEAARQAEAERLAEIARQAEAERLAVLAAQEAQRQAAQQRAWQPAPPEAFRGDAPISFGIVSPSPDFDSFRDAYRASGIPPGFASGSEGDFGVADRAEDGPRFEQPSAPRRPETAKVDPRAGQRAVTSDEFVDGAANVPQGQPVAGSEWQGRIYTSPPVAYPDFSAPQPAPRSAGEPFPASEPEPYASSRRFPAENREAASGPAWLAPELPTYRATGQSPAPGLSPGIAPSNADRYPAQSPNLAPGSGARSAAPPQPSAARPAPSREPVEPQAQFAPSYAQHAGPYAAHNPGQTPAQGGNSIPAPVEETLLGSRDRIAYRWYALKGVFDPQSAPAEQAPTPPPARVPVLAVFSLAGGVGKTSLVASLGRALSSRGERVLLVDTSAYGLLPFFFGARDQRPGQLRTFNPPGVSADAPIQLVTLDPESHPPQQPANPDPGYRQSGRQSDSHTAAPAAARDFQSQDFQSQDWPSQDWPSQDWLAQEVSRFARGANRVLIDLPTASGSATRRVLRLAPVVLIPVLPDMNSVVSVGAIEGFFRNHSASAGGKPVQPYYLLNQFDASLPLHLDVREILREQIGDRLIPFALRRSPAVSEALAEGMTVMDYAPNAVAAEDYANLAGWVRSFSAPAVQSYRGIRWSER